MYTRIYAPWEHYPKTLTQTEIQNPLSVIADFFSSDSVQGHGELLKIWRHYVTHDEYFNGRHGPASLIFDCTLNLKLLEAMFLLYSNYLQHRWCREKLTEDQLAEEKEKWEYFPENLSQNELLEPYKAVRKVFKKISPQAYRDHLNEWLEAALSKRSNDETLTARDIISVYENLLKLYSAAWLVHQRETAETMYNSKTDDMHITKPAQSFQLWDIHPNPTPAEILGLVEVKKLVLKCFPSVPMIIHLGTHQEPFTYFLLILIDDHEKTPEHQIANAIEDNCRPLTNVQIIAHKSGSAKNGIAIGQRFWHKAMTKGNIIYRSGDFEIPEQFGLEKEIWVERALFHWERWGVQGNEFLKGAERYKNDSNYRLAVFLLHQSVESVLKAVIQAILGYRVQMHNLTRLLGISLLFSDELKKVFETDTDEGKRLFALLQSAYSQSRYNNNFEPDEASIKALSEKAEKFYRTGEGIYNQFIQLHKL